MLKYVRGTVVLVDLGTINIGSHLTAKERPCIVVTNNKANEHSGLLTVIPTSTRIDSYGFHPKIDLEKRSQALVEQIRTIDSFQVKGIIGFLTESEMQRVEICIMKQLGLAKTESNQEFDYQELSKEFKKEENKPIIQIVDSNKIEKKEEPVKEKTITPVQNNHKKAKIAKRNKPRTEDEKLQIICDYEKLTVEEMMKKYGWNNKHTVHATIHKIKKEFNML